MTMVPIWKTCPRCLRRYDYNPDVGQFTCPYCMGLGKAKGIFEYLTGKKKDDNKRK